jgi:hypothetical protein
LWAFEKRKEVLTFAEMEYMSLENSVGGMLGMREEAAAWRSRTRATAASQRYVKAQSSVSAQMLRFIGDFEGGREREVAQPKAQQLDF